MTKIFLTGITGLVGSAFAISLLRERKDLSIVGMTRHNSVKTAAQRVEEIIRAQWEFDSCPGSPDEILPRISVIDGDVVSIDPAEVAKMPELAGVDTIFHCAADVNLGKDPEGKTFNINYNGTAKIIELAQLLNVKEFHYVSTAYTAGCMRGRAMEQQHEDHGHNNPYERSKWQAENLVRNCGIPFSIYRPGIVTGRLADGRIRKPLAVYRIFEFLAKMKSHYCAKNKLNPCEYVDMHLRFLTNKSERVYFAPIDFVQKSLAALVQLPVCNKTYHLTGNSPVTTDMIAQALCSVLRLEGVSINADDSNATDEDRMLSRFIGDLFPYFENDVIFDQTNIEAALGKEAIGWEFGKRGMEVLIHSYFEDFFGDVEWVKTLLAANK